MCALSAPTSTRCADGTDDIILVDACIGLTASAFAVSRLAKLWTLGKLSLFRTTGIGCIGDGGFSGLSRAGRLAASVSSREVRGANILWSLRLSHARMVCGWGVLPPDILQRAVDLYPDDGSDDQPCNSIMVLHRGTNRPVEAVLSSAQVRTGWKPSSWLRNCQNLVALNRRSSASVGQTPQASRSMYLDRR